MGKRFLEGRLIVAVDFDGTITTEPDMGKELILQWGCKRAMEALHEAGVEFILWTCRSGPALNEAIEFLKENNMFHMFSAINDQLEEIKEKYEPHVSRKLGVDFFVDDKNLCVDSIDWKLIEYKLLKELGKHD